MNHTKGKRLRHAAWLWLKRREVPAEHSEIRLGVSKLADDLTLQFGGDVRDLSTAQIVLIDRIVQMLAFAKLVEKHAWKTGPIIPDEDGSPRMTPSLSAFYVAASNSVARTLKTLCEMSEKRNGQSPPVNLKRYLETKASEK